MPSFSGGDSWGNLFYTTYEGVTGGYDAYTPNQAKNWPLNYEPTGYYVTSTSDKYGGEIYGRTIEGYWWENSSYGRNGSTYLLLTPTSGPTDGVRPGKLTSRGEGNAIRCVVRS